MFALIATVLTWTTTAVVVVARVAPRSVFFAAMTTSTSAQDHDGSAGVEPQNFTERIPAPVYYCDNSYQCPATYSVCENHLCTCNENFYQVYNSTSGKTYCQLCSLFQKSCAVTQCCQNSHATHCFNDMCVCKLGMDEECLGRYTPTLGIQLANTLSVSFAFVFLAITFIAVIRKTFRCSFCRCVPMSRTASDSSLNEFVKQKMQNRPPCYDDIEKDLKVPIDINNQPPPEYSAKHLSRVDTFRGVLNRAFSISDEVELNTAPPNYSTFTTVTNVVAAPERNDDNSEIILTRPIFYVNNSNSLRRT